MESVEKVRAPMAGRLVAAVIILAAILIAAYTLHRSSTHPSTDNATIDADLVHVAATVGGRIVHIGVEENGTVRKGDVLFEIDPETYRATLAQTQADLAIARAALESKRKAVATQRSVAVVSGDQVHRAEINRALAERTVDRLRPLVEKGYIPRQQFDQAEVALRDATTSLIQAREQGNATANAVDTIADAEANVQAREAAVAVARKALNDAVVRAPHNGRVVGLTVSTGEVVAPSQALFTLVNADQWFAIGNFRETALKYIRVGDCATVYSLIDRSHSIHGGVDGIGAGVLDDARINLPRSVPLVQKELNWVRIEQRFPVRVRLDKAPAELTRVGASAVIEIRHGAACG